MEGIAGVVRAGVDTEGMKGVGGDVGVDGMGDEGEMGVGGSTKEGEEGKAEGEGFGIGGKGLAFRASFGEGVEGGTAGLEGDREGEGGV